MNADQLLAHYDRIADEPDAIARLRHFILDLAVRGKLVSQDPNDEPASKMLKRIELEKASLSTSGRGNSQEQHGSTSGVTDLFDVPSGWKWVPATHPALIISDMDKKVQTKDVLESGEFPVVDQGRVFIRGYCNDPSKVIRVDSPLILFGDHTRETKLIDFDFVVGADGVKLLKPLCLNANYYHLALQWIPLESRGYGRHFKLLRESQIPLPPKAEQDRIVAKVEELMALCDQLEAARAEREATRDRLAASSLSRLNAPDPEFFQDDARFVLNTLPALTTRSDQIKQLRQTILNVAVRGKLVLAEKNQEFPDKFLAEGMEKELVRQDFEVPSHWKWVTVGNTGQARLGKMLDRSKNRGSLHRYLRNINVRWFDFDLTDVLTMRFEDTELKEFELRVGDVLICEGGEPGRAAVWDGREMNIYFQKAIHRVRFPESVDATYFVLALRASADDGRLKDYFTGTGIKHFTGKGLNSYRFPLPPLPEQHRIVAKVDELMTLCDQLEASLRDSSDTTRLLSEALLAEALAPVESREFAELATV